MRTPGWCVLVLLGACGPSGGEGPTGDDSGTANDGSADADEHSEASSGIGDATTSEQPPAQPARLRDETAAVFDWVCGADPNRPDHCSIVRIPDGSPPVPDCPDAGYSYAWSDYFEIVGVCDFHDPSGWWSLQDWERCVVCTSENDCPQLVDRGDFFECRDGYCRNVDPDKYADLPSQGCGNTAPRYGCDDPTCSSGVPG